MIEGRINKDLNGDYYIALNDGQTEWKWEESMLLEDLIMSIPSLLEEYPNLKNKEIFENIFETKELL